MMLMEGREHLFSHDEGQGTPVGLWQLIATSLVFQRGLHLARRRDLPGGRPAARGGRAARRQGPDRGVLAPLGIPGVLVVGHTLFGAGLAWLGYALYLAHRPAKRRVSTLR